MSQHEFEKNVQVFLDLIQQKSDLNNVQMNTLRHYYAEQNLGLLNDIFLICIDNLKRLEKINTVNDIICTHVKLTNDMNKKISQSTQQFLDSTIGQIDDHNEWLKAHCDLATD